jgi:cytochrome c biogenesis protein
MTARNALKQAWQYLTRLNVAAILIVIVLMLAALGSCFPQLPASVATDAERLASWETGLRTRYGALTDLLATLRVFAWFRSSVFLLSLTLLAIATLVCTLDRWRPVWRRVFRPPTRPSAAIFDAAPHTARLSGFSATDLPRIVGERLERGGFHVWSESAGDLVYMRGDRNRLAPLATLVTHLAALLLLLGAVISSGLGWREELSIPPDATAEIGHKSRLAVRNDDFHITRYPDESVASYQAQVAVIDGDLEVARGTVQVNEPLSYGGLGLYLSGYRESEGRYDLTLVAVRDPGYSLVIAAGFLLLLGMTVSFNFPRAWIQACFEPDGTLRLAGWGERRAYNFEREFRSLVEDLEGWKIGRTESKHPHYG